MGIPPTQTHKEHLSPHAAPPLSSSQSEFFEISPEMVCPGEKGGWAEAGSPKSVSGEGGEGGS